MTRVALLVVCLSWSQLDQTGHSVVGDDGPDPDPVLCQLAEDQIRLYPKSRAVDLYKFAHQAAFGPEHAIPDQAYARHRLDDEMIAVSDSEWTGPGRPLLEPLLPDGSLVRVHLRPWIEAGLGTDPLLHAFVQTANTHQGSTEILEDYWTCFERLADERVIRFRRDSLSEFLHEREAEGWPPYHHSQGFEAAYAPAYRVVAQEHLPEPLRR